MATADPCRHGCARPAHGAGRHRSRGCRNANRIRTDAGDLRDAVDRAGLLSGPGQAGGHRFARLPEPDAQQLEAVVAAARVFERPPPPAATGGDRRLYTITIEQGDQRRELQLSEPIDDPELQRLVRFLEAQASALRSKPRPPASPEAGHGRTQSRLSGPGSRPRRRSARTATPVRSWR